MKYFVIALLAVALGCGDIDRPSEPVERTPEPEPELIESGLATIESVQWVTRLDAGEYTIDVGTNALVSYRVLNEAGAVEKWQSPVYGETVRVSAGDGKFIDIGFGAYDGPVQWAIYREAK